MELQRYIKLLVAIIFLVLNITLGLSNTVPYDLNGNVLVANNMRYQYSIQNKIISIAQAQSTTNQFYYPNGMLALALSTDFVNAYYYNVENKLTNALALFKHQASSFLVSLDDDLPLSKHISNGDTIIFLEDVKHSLIAKLMPNTIATFSYTAYGQIHANSHLTADFGLGFSYRGYLYNHNTQSYYLVHRDYNPPLRAFMQVDSYGYDQHALPNGYDYADDNPVKHIDPSGHMTEPTPSLTDVSRYLTDIAISVLTPPADWAHETFKPIFQSKKPETNSINPTYHDNTPDYSTSVIDTEDGYTDIDLKPEFKRATQGMSDQQINALSVWQGFIIFSAFEETGPTEFFAANEIEELISNTELTNIYDLLSKTHYHTISDNNQTFSGMIIPFRDNMSKEDFISMSKNALEHCQVCFDNIDNVANTLYKKTKAIINPNRSSEYINKLDKRNKSMLKFDQIIALYQDN
ncbi:RHS repeat protein [Cysteiniphilum halobium]|uniref:RHS repeat protein n=1 Tax=Cysteiniphilum halobium TaxID=2219059 RepID=UPI000E64EF88|nr:RHS repeat-associated core domain-containing protein [Cysteiniphilum halobium]